MGYVYIVKVEGTDYYKIGITSNPDISSRLKSMQTGNPFQLSLVKFLPCVNSLEAERYAHTLLRKYLIRGEWFQGAEQEIINTYILAIAMSNVDHALLEDSNQIKSREEMIAEIESEIPAKMLHGPLTDEEKTLVINWISDAPISRKAVCRRIYKLRGGTKKDYKGDGPLYSVIKQFIDALEDDE